MRSIIIFFPSLIMSWPTFIAMVFGVSFCDRIGRELNALAPSPSQSLLQIFFFLFWFPLGSHFLFVLPAEIGGFLFDQRNLVAVLKPTSDARHTATVKRPNNLPLGSRYPYILCLHNIIASMYVCGNTYTR